MISELICCLKLQTERRFYNGRVVIVCVIKVTENNVQMQMLLFCLGLQSILQS